jgi:hypothetical protein
MEPEPFLAVILMLKQQNSSYNLSPQPTSNIEKTPPQPLLQPNKPKPAAQNKN